MKISDKTLNYLHLHFIVFIWGFTAVLGALISIEAVPLVWYRMLLAAGFIFVFLKIRRIPYRFPPRTLLLFSVAGLIIGLHWITFFMAIKAANVSVTLAVISTGAFFTAFLEPLFYKRKIIAYEVLFGLLVILGLYIIFEVDAQYTTGIVLALVSAFLSALFSVVNGKLAVKYNAVAISFWELSVGMLLIGGFLLLSGKMDRAFFTVPAADWMYLLLLATFCTAYAFIASVHVMKWIKPYTVMLTINMEPIYGILLALWVLGDAEHMSVEFYYGALIILGTVVANGIIKMRLKRKRKLMKI